MKRPCSIDDCDRPSAARGWCGKHYSRWLNFQEVEGPSYDPDAIPLCECPEPAPYDGPLTLVRSVPLPGQCTKCMNPVYEALIAAANARRAEHETAAA